MSNTKKVTTNLEISLAVEPFDADSWATYVTGAVSVDGGDNAEIDTVFERNLHFVSSAEMSKEEIQNEIQEIVKGLPLMLEKTLVDLIRLRFLKEKLES